MLREQFINPLNLPIMTESYLRKDFNFALYTGYCYGKLLVKFFKWSLFSAILFFVIVLILNLVLQLL